MPQFFALISISMPALIEICKNNQKETIVKLQ